MARGYQPLELPQLDPLFSQKKYFNFAVALLSWLIEQLNIELIYQLDGAELKIISVEYYGAYPCLGIHYDYPGETPNLEPLIEATIDRLLQERPLIEFVTFLSAGGEDWNTVTAKIMADQDHRGD